jgi:hypothetical protein
MKEYSTTFGGARICFLFRPSIDKVKVVKNNFTSLNAKTFSSVSLQKNFLLLNKILFSPPSSSLRSDDFLNCQKGAMLLFLLVARR